jgi:outer membrane protein
MPVKSSRRSRLASAAIIVLLAPIGAAAQTGQSAPANPTMIGPARPLSIDEAVTLALEQNLNVQVERLNPQLQDLAISQARTSWTPAFSAGFVGRRADSPPSSFLSGGEDKITDTNTGGVLGVQQLLPWGMSYNVTWDNARVTTNNIFSSFNPLLRSNIDASVTQPLLRDFRMNSARWQLLLSQKGREIADVDLQQTIALTIRNVKSAYWDYKYAVASLDVARQSLELAEESLRNTRSRVEIGTLAPIDVVEAEAEVAQREEAVILAEASIGQTEDRLRALIFDPSTPEFWNLRIEATDPVPFQVQSVDVEAAIRRALDERTDLAQSKKSIERTSISERYYRNQTLPDLNLQLTYNATGIAGTQLVRGPGTFPPPIIGEEVRGYGTLLGDVFGAAFPTWQFSVNVTYPIGRSNAEAALASTRLQVRQANTSLRNLELQVATQVRDAGRQLVANSKRVDATRAARVLAERRLEAEEKKFTAGMSTSFLVFQAQRDLAQARNNELRATLDYTKSHVDFETVQVAPVAGGASFGAAVSGAGAVSGFGGAAGLGAGAGVTGTGTGAANAVRTGGR